MLLMQMPQLRTSLPIVTTLQISSLDQARLHEASEALREHVLPSLTFQELIALSRTCTNWQHVISATPFHQLLAICLKGLLPNGLTSSKSFQQVLQRQNSHPGQIEGQDSNQCSPSPAGLPSPCSLPRGMVCPDNPGQAQPLDPGQAAAEGGVSA